MSTNTEQRDFWSDDAGPIWVDQRETMDAILAPVLDRTLGRAALKDGDSVLDIGCGAGTSTFAVADIVGPTGHVSGFDISRTLLEAAQMRVLGRTNVGFLDADVQSHPFVAQSADAIISRFGVMFFSDSRAAFENMALALRSEGTISFSAWGAIPDNPFFTLPAQIARQILGPVPKSDPDAPGPFALRDPAYVKAMLNSADLEADIDVRTELLTCAAGPLALAQTMCLIGPAHGAILHHRADETMRRVLLDALVDAFAQYQTQSGVEIPARINYVTARKAS
ncbi:class I SAM-dependent methyltransferase [uncultured Sulfitobacter sp.]|uniref:class I SAM-dependent methyltransferase n=1 Tax=uncultured Sulfitobacter sp. TaxID=191468 RepID=UPI002615DF1A|nr:class I SAM-dependent methyltransferase [uncultured Sulfitobacter sp.]